MNKPIDDGVLKPAPSSLRESRPSPHGRAAADARGTPDAREPALESERSGARVGISRPHESAHLHVAGAAPYVDDLPELAGTLHAALGLSPVAHGRLKSIDVTAAHAGSRTFNSDAWTKRASGAFCRASAIIDFEISIPKTS